MTPLAQRKADEAKSLLVHYLHDTMGGRGGPDLIEEMKSIVDLIIDAAVQEACYQMSQDPDDDREPIAEGDYHLYRPPGRIGDPEF